MATAVRGVCSSHSGKIVLATRCMSKAANLQGAVQQAKIILGSASQPRRVVMQELSEEYGFSFQVMTADIDEKVIRRPTAQQLVVALAHAKAQAIRQRLEDKGELDGYLITCDQVVQCGDSILEKPVTAEQAREYIKAYGKCAPSTVSSIVCSNLATGEAYEGVDIATIRFNPIPLEVVESLINEGSIYTCAGGLQVENPLVSPYVQRIDGTMDSVMGLPKQLLLRLLLQAASTNKFRVV